MSHGALPLLLCTLATVIVLAPQRHLFLGKDHQSLQFHWTHAESMTYDHLRDAINLAPRHYFVSGRSVSLGTDGEVVPSNLYNRFPMGGRFALHLATRPFDDPYIKVRVARAMMVALFLGGATLAYLALTILTVNRWAAMAATLLGFGSSYQVNFHDMVATQAVVDLFGVMLVFHGMAMFTRTGHRGQLFAKTCVALLLGWHVFALLLPFVVLGIARGLAPWRPARVRWHFGFGLAALAVGAGVLAFNVVGEFLALQGATPWTELPAVRSALYRTGLVPTRDGAIALAPAPASSIGGWTVAALWTQFGRVGEASLPHFLVAGIREAFDNSAVSVALGGLGVAATLGAATLATTARRGRLALTSLAVSGWCWALPMRNAVHPFQFQFEAMFFVGVPLVVYALALQRIAVRRVPFAHLAGAAAAICFVCSAAVLARERHARIDFGREAALRVDVNAMRDVAGEQTLLHSPMWNAPMHWKYRAGVLLAGHPLHPGAEHVVAYAMPHERSLTPGNQLVFLYRRADFDAALTDLVARYRTAMRESSRVVTSECCDVYSLGREILYHDRDCRLPPSYSPGATFFLHVTPVDVRRLPPYRRAHGFGNYNFEPHRRFLRHDGVCVAVVRLPPYDIAEVHTGQFRKVWLADRTADYRSIWEGRFSPLPPAPSAGDGAAPAPAPSPP